MIPLMWGTQSGQNHRDRKYNGVVRGWGNEELLFNGYGVLALKDEELQRWMVVLVEHCKCI